MEATMTKAMREALDYLVFYGKARPGANYRRDGERVTVAASTLRALERRGFARLEWASGVGVAYPTRSGALILLDADIAREAAARALTHATTSAGRVGGSRRSRSR